MILICKFSNHHKGYRAFVKNCTVNKQNTIIKTVKGKHLHSKSNLDVEFLEFCKCEKMKYIPNIADHFPNLKILWIKSCNIKYIYKKNLKKLNKLEELELDDNQIAFLPHDLFINNPKLKSINMANNPFIWIGYKILDVLPNLNYIYIYSMDKKIYCLTKKINNLNFINQLLTLKMKLYIHYRKIPTLFNLSFNKIHLYLDNNIIFDNNIKLLHYLMYKKYFS
jgi:hypothetical protein